MKHLLWLLKWILKAAIFFTLFAFALNNQQDTTVHFFFGTQWRAPQVLVVLTAFAVGVVVGVLGMVPRWWKHRSATGQTQLTASTAIRHNTPQPPRMDFDLSWILLGLPLAFVLGWVASRLDLRQLRIENRQAPKAYFKGLNFLLNEQQDQAIDAFIEAVQNDPDTSELHFALGNLFRRRGEYERAVRVHEHLLSRGDLSLADRQRAQHALALDYLKAGLLDRAEEALLKLEGTPFEAQARLALLANYERSRDWPHAAQIAQKLEHADQGSFHGRLAHYLCEQAAACISHRTRTSRSLLRKRRSLRRPMRRDPALIWPACWRARANRKKPTRRSKLASSPAAIPLIAGPLAEFAVACGHSLEAPGTAQNQLRTIPLTGCSGRHRGARSHRQGPHAHGARLVRAASGTRAVAGRRRQMDCRRKARTRAISSASATGAGPCRQTVDALPLCRLRL